MRTRVYSYQSAHHKTRDHMTVERGLYYYYYKKKFKIQGSLVYSETTRVIWLSCTHLVRRDVLVGLVEAGIGGETALAHLDGSGCGHQAVRIGDVALSEYDKQLSAVVAHLHVFGEGREQTERHAGPTLKHGRSVNSCGGGGESRRRRLVSLVEQRTGEVRPVAGHDGAAVQ